MVKLDRRIAVLYTLSLVLLFILAVSESSFQMHFRNLFLPLFLSTLDNFLLLFFSLLLHNAPPISARVSMD